MFELLATRGQRLFRCYLTMAKVLVLSLWRLDGDVFYLQKVPTDLLSSLPPSPINLIDILNQID